MVYKREGGASLSPGQVGGWHRYACPGGLSLFSSGNKSKNPYASAVLREGHFYTRFTFSLMLEIPRVDGKQKPWKQRR